MKARIKFKKYGAMKFVGHLDVMRYFQKVCRRANIDNEYSKGFSPHQIMSFAAPLGVGLTSDAEYLDVQLLSADEPQVMMDRMNAAVTEGFSIIGYQPLLEAEQNQKTVTAMSLVGAADYLVSLKDGYAIHSSIENQMDFQEVFQNFYELKEIVIDKKTKTSEKAVDIKPMIRYIAFDSEEYETKKREGLSDTVKAAQTTVKASLIMDNASQTMVETSQNTVKASPATVKEASVADVYENGIKVYMQVDTGSAANLKPELVMEAFYDRLGVPFNKFAWQVHRLEVYAKLEDGKLAALDQLDR